VTYGDATYSVNTTLSPNVREAAACSIGNLGNPHPKPIEALRYVAAKDQVEWARQMAERSAAQLSRR